MFCRNCGTLNQDNVINCVRCNHPLQPSAGTIQNLPKVASHLVLAIIVTSCCCVPLGIVSIVYAAQVKSKLQAGDYYGALDCSKKAAIWGWIGLGIGLLWIVIYGVFILIRVIAEGKRY